MPEIATSDEIIVGKKYKMVVGEAVIRPADEKYIYFDSPSTYKELRIYLDPPVDSSVKRYTTFGTLLTEYHFKVIIEITKVAPYTGRLTAIFE